MDTPSWSSQNLTEWIHNNSPIQNHLSNFHGVIIWVNNSPPPKNVGPSFFYIRRLNREPPVKGRQKFSLETTSSKFMAWVTSGERNFRKPLFLNHSKHIGANITANKREHPFPNTQSMVYYYTHIWLIFLVNVGEYTTCSYIFSVWDADFRPFEAQTNQRSMDFFKSH